MPSKRQQNSRKRQQRRLQKILTLAAIVLFGYSNYIGVEALSSSKTPPRLWQILESQPPVEAWKAIFGASGERGEYMDGYSKQAMLERCTEDYHWELSSEELAKERADMMSHLYDHPPLWEHTSMVAFAEHYVLCEDGEFSGKPFRTFQRQKELQPSSNPIFSGVVCVDWREEDALKQKLLSYSEQGIDYVRMHCDFGSPGGPTQLPSHPQFRLLAQAAKASQDLEMVPLVLLQVPWRDPSGEVLDFYRQAIQSLANAFQEAKVDYKQFLLETRPPIGISAQQEEDLKNPARIALGLELGRNMFEAMDQTFGPIAGFCVAGGSTKGEFPTAMQDDTQNAVRQGLRERALHHWGYELCFWEMGAKLLLQPQVGQLWGLDDRNAARELFCANAESLAKEIQASVPK